MLECSEYPETPKRSILREVTNQSQGASPTANLKLLTSVALKKEEAKPQRKDKSLQKLCDRFLELYPLYGPSSGVEIHLDSTAQSLGVERRRIYDIINILEALHCATHCRKNTYTWHGASKLDRLLDELKKRAEGGTNSSPKKRSLGLLAQKFLMMFLIQPPDTLINLEMAIGKLIRPGNNYIVPLSHDDRQHKSKVRRLYDISNVLSSIGLIEKVPGSTILKKPVFRYKGLNAIRNNLVSTPHKCSTQLTPPSLPDNRVKPHITVHSKRKLEFSSPIIESNSNFTRLASSSVIYTPITPRLSSESPSHRWNEILVVANMEYARLKGAST